MIAIIDYGAGNLRSVRNAFAHLGIATDVVEDPEHLKQAHKIILPGVGAFGAAMESLRNRGFDEMLRTRVSEGIPLLGICLGLQLLYEASDEMGEHVGLGLLPGKVVRFPEIGDLKIPHIGWNILNPQRAHPLLNGLPENAYVYYVHSYYVRTSQADDILATTRYGLDFVAIAGRDRVMGIQFHPEKSQSIGLRMLKNYAEMEMPT